MSFSLSRSKIGAFTLGLRNPPHVATYRSRKHLEKSQSTEMAGFKLIQMTTFYETAAKARTLGNKTYGCVYHELRSASQLQKWFISMQFSSRLQAHCCTPGRNPPQYVLLSPARSSHQDKGIPSGANNNTFLHSAHECDSYHTSQIQRKMHKIKIIFNTCSI